MNQQHVGGLCHLSFRSGFKLKPPRAYPPDSRVPRADPFPALEL